MQGSKGVAPKTKLNLKPLRTIGRHKGPQPTFMQIVPLNTLSKYEVDSYSIMRIITKLMVHEHAISDFHTRNNRWKLAYIEMKTPLTQAFK
jgi:hypothetical protein